MLIFLPLVWIVGGALLADAYPSNARYIIPVAVCVPAIGASAVFGRSATVFILVIGAAVGCLAVVSGAWPLWVGVVVLVCGVVLLLIGEAIGLATGLCKRAD